MERVTGSCRCGNVRIAAAGRPYRVGLCHCLDCRKHHGALFHASAIFPRDAVTVTWLRQFYRGGCEVSRGDSRKWLVSLVYPSGFGSVLDLMTDRAIWRQWREELPDRAARA